MATRGQKLRADFKTRAEAPPASRGTRPGPAVILVGEDPVSQGRRAQEGLRLRPGRAPTPRRSATLPMWRRSSSSSGSLNSMTREETRHPGPVAAAATLRQRAVIEAIPRTRTSTASTRERRAALMLGRPRSSPARHTAHADARRAGIDAQGRTPSSRAQQHRGRPMAMLLTQANATVTICHAQTRDLAFHTRQADIVVAAAGQPALVTAEMVSRAPWSSTSASTACRTASSAATSISRPSAKRRGDHAGTRRRRADDHHDAARQHASKRLKSKAADADSGLLGRRGDGSDSDWPTMQAAAVMLKEFGVPFEARCCRRIESRMFSDAESAAARGLKPIIAGAGGAAHLPGMLAAKTAVPVLGVPIPSKYLRGEEQPAVDRADAEGHSGGDVRDR